MTAIGATTLPHWMLSTVTVAGARNTTALTPKLVGFQRCRPLDAQHVLRRDRDEAGQEVRPQERRADEDAGADAADVGARRVRPLRRR